MIDAAQIIPAHQDHLTIQCLNKINYKFLFIKRYEQPTCAFNDQRVTRTRKVSQDVADLNPAFFIQCSDVRRCSLFQKVDFRVNYIGCLKEWLHPVTVSCVLGSRLYWFPVISANGVCENGAHHCFSDSCSYS